MPELFSVGLLLFLVVSSIAVSRAQDLVSAVILFIAYGLVMAIVWQQLHSPDIAITEAAIGAGITSLLFLLAIARTERFQR